MQLYLRTLCLCMIVTSLEALSRHRRAGGKVDLPKRVRPPIRIRKGETPVPRPGWTHCVHPVKATERWRLINSMEFKNILTTQFQCTWSIEAERSGMRVQIAIQKLELGNTQGACQQFLEIIDNGRSQGRFCKFDFPGDYVTMGPKVRIDIQGDGALAQLVRDKRAPFKVAYRSVPQVIEEGLRIGSKPTVPKAYDRYHTGTQRILRRPINGNGLSNNGRKNNKDKDKSSGGKLTTAQLVAISVCCGIVAIFVFAIILWRCCCITNKRGHDPEKNPNHAAKNGYANHAYPLPGNELIIASEVVRPCRASKSTSSGHISHEGKLEKRPLDGSKDRKTRTNQKRLRHKSRDQKKRSSSPEKRRRRKGERKEGERRSRNDEIKDERRHNHRENKTREHKRSERHNRDKQRRSEKQSREERRHKSSRNKKERERSSRHKRQV